MASSVPDFIAGEAWDSFLAVQWSLFELNPSSQSVNALVTALSLVRNKGLLSETWAVKWVSLLINSLVTLITS